MLIRVESSIPADELVQRVLDGNFEYIVSHTGTSQYKGQTGNSACGLAALNFARVTLAKVEAGRTDILQEIIAKSTAAKVSVLISHHKNVSMVSISCCRRSPEYVLDGRIIFISTSKIFVKSLYSKSH